MQQRTNQMKSLPPGGFYSGIFNCIKKDFLGFPDRRETQILLPDNIQYQKTMNRCLVLREK